MSKSQNKYRNESRRLPNWDYSANGSYFVTFVTANRKAYFGKIISDEMHLNPFGQIALTQWKKSFDIRQELFCDEFIIMPNHIHAILIINQPEINQEIVEEEKNYGVAKRMPKSISSFMAGYKSTVLNAIDDYIDENKIDYPKFNRQNPLWQSNYHDRVIRNEKEFYQIKNYIQNNPNNWVDDSLFG